MDKTAMYKITYGLYVVTAKEGDKDNGCIANTAGQVTSSPNRISVTLNKSNYTHGMIARTGVFNVSVLSQDADFSLFKRFGFVSGGEVDKFADFTDCRREGNGVLSVTQGANAVLCAKVVQTIDLGTHTMFIADVTDAAVLNGVSSVTYEYYQSDIKPKPQETRKEHNTVWRCKICGYEYAAEQLPEDFVCPICKHGADDFEKV